MKLTARVVGRAAFLVGRVVQDSPLYGAERRGAPVMAFVRVAGDVIHERGYVERPDVLVLLDVALLEQPAAGVLDGVGPATVVLANSPLAAGALQAGRALPGRVVTLDVSAIALAELGRHVPGTAAAAFTVKATGLAPWDALAEAVAAELTASAVTGAALERNLAAARRAFDAAPSSSWPPREAAPAAPAGPAFVVPRLPARVAAPVIRAAGTSAARTMGGWRVERPVIDAGGCTRCALCFLLCPEGAIRRDADGWPAVDYAHCKGCLVCVHECPPHAIAAVREMAG